MRPNSEVTKNKLKPRPLMAKNNTHESCGTKVRPNRWNMRFCTSRKTAGLSLIGIHGNRT